MLCSCLLEASLVAQNLPFSPKLVQLAEEIILSMKESGAPAYNGLHLRIENDAQDWLAIMGGEEVRRAYR